MLKRVRGRITYANVMSTIAVVFAVGGGVAYAANTVFSSDIVNGEVKTQDLANNAVTSPKVQDNDLTGADVNEATLDGVDAAPLGGHGPSDFLTPVPGKAAATDQDNVATLEC